MDRYSKFHVATFTMKRENTVVTLGQDGYASITVTMATQRNEARDKASSCDQSKRYQEFQKNTFRCQLYKAESGI